MGKLKKCHSGSTTFQKHRCALIFNQIVKLNFKNVQHFATLLFISQKKKEKKEESSNNNKIKA